MTNIIIASSWVVGILAFIFTIFKMKKVILDLEMRLKNSQNESEKTIYKTYIPKYKMIIIFCYIAMVFITFAVIFIPIIMRI